ncbi:MAG: DUF58 domain-containing protein [Rubripirellula sp.]
MTESREHTDTLLPPALLARLERLELASRKIFRGQLKGERRSRRRGQSVEFDDFRTYVPGDDLRLIDWNLFARLDQLFLKLFQEEEDRHFFALIDSSRSMQFGEPSKLLVAKQLAAALGYVGLCRSDRVCVQALGHEGRKAPVLRSRSSLWRMLKYLESLEDRGQTSLSEGVRDFSMQHTGTGIVVLISDFLDKEGFESALRMLVNRRMDVYVMHLLAEEELDPVLRGDRRLIDCEDGDVSEITINQYAIDKYKSNVSEFIESLKSFCARRSIAYVPISTEMPLEHMVTNYLRQRGVVR